MDEALGKPLSKTTAYSTWNLKNIYEFLVRYGVEDAARHFLGDGTYLVLIEKQIRTWIVLSLYYFRLR